MSVWRIFESALRAYGRRFGDEADYLVCGTCERRWGGWGDDDPGQVCPCGGTVYAHIPASEALVVSARIWKGNRKWWPQRYTTLDGTEAYTHIMWLGREWRKRPDPWFTDLMAQARAELDSEVGP